MRRVGFEPTHPFGQGLLRAPRLPFRHRRTRESSVSQPRSHFAARRGPHVTDERHRDERPLASAGDHSRGLRRSAGEHAGLGGGVAPLQLDVPALLEAAHGERDQQHLHGHDQ